MMKEQTKERTKAWRTFLQHVQEEWEADAGSIT